jgi:hypothetical protein
VPLVSCGTGTKIAPATPLSGNWQITLNRQTNPVPLTYTGFLLQTNNSVTGSLILGDGCSGDGPVKGTINGQSLQLDVNEFGQNLTLTAALPSTGSASTFLGGQFSTVTGGCTYSSSGTWSAVQVAPITGPFHGKLVSSAGNGTVDVAGTFTQGPNTGASYATLSATLSTTSVPPFCSYVATASITGVISGTTATLFFFDANGTQMNTFPLVATVALDGTSLTVDYFFLPISSSCQTGNGQGDTGTLKLSFP